MDKRTILFLLALTPIIAQAVTLEMLQKGFKLSEKNQKKDNFNKFKYNTLNTELKKQKSYKNSKKSKEKTILKLKKFIR